MDIKALLQHYWDEDAATYDRSLGHRVSSSAERAAWTAVFRRYLPAPPARVLDVGAGTGFISLALARLGYDVTALDLSSGMLGRLRDSAGEAGLTIDIVEGSADAPPSGPFDVVLERLLLWTLPDPQRALAEWRRVAPAGRLLAFEGLWGSADRVESLRDRARERLRRWRGLPDEHHGPYTPEMNARLPLDATPPRQIVELVEESGWGPAGIERLWDVEWTIQLALSPVERLLGVTPQFLISAEGDR